jgi:hypothetical protein
MQPPKRRSTHVPPPDVPAVTPLPLQAVLDGPRPGLADPDADRAWLALRKDLHAALCGSASFDPRLGLGLAAPLKGEWERQRLAWLVERFRGDRRLL